MSDTSTNHEDHAHEHYIVPVWKYGIVLSLLAILMVLTVVASFYHFGDLASPVIAIMIAISKAVLIVLIFMNVFYSSKLTKIFVAGGFFWLLFLFGMIIVDFLSRRMVTTPEPWN